MNLNLVEAYLPEAQSAQRAERQFGGWLIMTGSSRFADGYIEWCQRLHSPTGVDRWMRQRYATKWMPTANFRFNEIRKERSRRKEGRETERLDMDDVPTAQVQSTSEDGSKKMVKYSMSLNG